MNTQENALPVEDSSEPKGKRRPWLRWSLFVLFGILLLILFAPTLVSKTSLRSYLLSQLLPADAGTMSIGDMEIGWLSPTQLSNVQVNDADGASLLTVDEIRLDRTLIDLAKNWQNLGSIVIEKPVLNLNLRDDGSNLEDTMWKLLSSEPAETSSSSAMVSANIKLIDATINIKEAATQVAHQFKEVNVEADLPSEADSDWNLAAVGKLDGQPFELTLATPLAQATEEWPLGPTGKARLQAENLPLGPLRYAARRAGQPLEQLAGRCSSKLDAMWKPNASNKQPDFTAQGNVHINGLVLASSAFLGDDILRLNDAQLDTKIHLTDREAVLEKGEFRADFGNAKLVTSVDLSLFNKPESILDSLRRQKLNTNGEIDLVRLTKLLPNTLRIQDDVEIANGRIAWNVKTELRDTTTAWYGELHTEDIQVLRGGRPIDWQFPLEISFSAIDDNQEIVLENLTARSDFFALAGKGKLREGQLQAQADLERLVFQLGQVMDLGNIYVTGQMRSYVVWNEIQANQLSVDAKTKLSDFQMRQNTQLLCEERDLNTAVVATATLSGQEIASLDSARVDVVSGQDYLVAQLQQPIAKPTLESDWNVACRLKGEIASWFGRLKTIGLGREWRATGQLDSTAHLTANIKKATVHRFTADVRNLQAETEGLQVAEPVLQMQTEGIIDIGTLSSQFPVASVASQSISVTARELAIGVVPHFAASGKLSYRADVGRLLSYLPIRRY